MPNDAKGPNVTNKVDRRKFIGGAAATAGAMIIDPALVHGTAANSAVRVGLLGCGGRGTEDATNLIDAGARVIALADLFQDQLDAAHANFDKIQLANGFAALDKTQLFVGPNAYQLMAASKEVDAVVIATPPYYHPLHLESIVTSGKHVYLEKPVAVDVPGAMKVIEIGKRAEGQLSLDVGFQIRDCPPFVELVKRIHDGALGKIVCGEAHYLTGYIDRPAWPNASPTERRLRNWVYDRMLSGDIIVEQNIHVIDIRGVPVSRRCGRDVQFDTICEGLVGRHGKIFWYQGNVAIAVQRAAGNLGRAAVAVCRSRAGFGAAAGVLDHRKLSFES